MEQIPPQMGETQGVVQLLLLSAQLIEQQLQLNEPVGVMADGDRGEALVVGAEGSTGSNGRGDAQEGEQRQGLGATWSGFAGGRVGVRLCWRSLGCSGRSRNGGIR